MDANGKIGGLLDIAKCLYDAVNRLGKAAKKKAAEETGEDDSTVMIGAVMEAAKAMKGKASAKNQRALQVRLSVAVAVLVALKNEKNERGWRLQLPSLPVVDGSFGSKRTKRFATSFPGCVVLF